jgi:hypothetical protein
MGLKTTKAGNFLPNMATLKIRGLLVPYLQYAFMTIWIKTETALTLSLLNFV